MATNNSKKSNSKSTTKKTPGSSKKQPTPNYQKQAVKAVKKAAKKNPKVFLIILLVAVVVIGIGVAVYFLFLKDKLGPKGGTSSEQTSSEVVSTKGDTSSEQSSSEVVSSEEHSHDHSYDPVITKGMSINFIEFENYHTGDSTYIKVGENIDILIDAGSTQASASTIKNFVNKYCTDGTLEYVIATHAHQDHIAGFVGTTKIPGVFESYNIDTFIEFAGTNQDPAKGLYNNYITKREAAKTAGKLAHHYTAAQCINETDGAKKEYTLAEGLTMTILDQRYYTESTGDENNYSVCALFTQGSNHYLFTGDLEKEGEESLVERNTLPHCQLFKGGHHGSKTSNTEKLLSVIQPEVVCICCCAGNDEYTSNVDNQFPTQTAINNIAKYTKYIYVTSVTTDGHTGFTSMNGNINFKCEDGVNYVVGGSNNSVILKESEWFTNNRTWPEGGK